MYAPYCIQAIHYKTCNCIHTYVVKNTCILNLQHNREYEDEINKLKEQLEQEKERLPHMSEFVCCILSIMYVCTYTNKFTKLHKLFVY